MNNIPDLEKLYSLSLHFINPLSLEQTYKIIADEAKQLLNAEYSTILIYSGKSLVRVFSTSPVIAKTQVRQSGRTYKVFRTGQPFIVKVRKPKDINSAQYMLHVKSIIFIPLTIQKQTIGVINVLSRRDYKLKSHDLLSLHIFGAMVSLCIQNAYLFEESKRALEMRDLFFAAASHELKTPTTTIKLYGQLVKKEIERRNMPNPDWMRILLHETERVTKLVNQFLLVNKIKTGHLEFQFKETNLKEILYHALIEFKANHPHKISLNDNLNGKNDYLLADSDKLLEAIINVLDNAAKYSPQESKITISLAYKSPNFVVTIRDHGQGISKKDLKDIFNIFVKGTSNVKEGIGLGLFLTKSIVEGHHGKININSKVNEGAMIKIILPDISVTNK